MKKDDSFWDETMDNLDDKYIRETAEKLAEHEESVKQYAPVLLKIPEKKKKEHGGVFAVAAGLALVAGLALTAVIIANTRGIDIKPSQTCNTTPPPVAATEDSTTPLVSHETTAEIASDTETEDPPKTIPYITITGETPDNNDAPKTTVIYGTPNAITTITEANKDEADYLPEALFTKGLNKDLSLFEKQFYGRWINCEDRSEEKVLYLTYGKDCFGPVDNYWHYFESFYSDGSGDYMVGMNGGLHECFYIPTDEPDHLYHYTDVGGPIEKKDYSFCYEREAPADAYDSIIMASTGRISYLGYLRLKQLTGFEMPQETTVITFDGVEWVKASSISRECGNLYASDITQNDRLVLTQQYIRMDTIDNAESQQERQYITLYFRKKDNKWEFNYAERYMSGLEPVEYGSEAYGIVSERVDEINSTLDEKTCTIEQDIEYFTDSDGFYYAIRRIYPSMAKDEEYDEVYWFDGTNYQSLLYDDDSDSALVIGKIIDTALVDNKLYVYANDNGTNIVMTFGNTSYTGEQLKQVGGAFHCKFIGEYAVVMQNDKYAIYSLTEDFNRVFEADSVTISADGKSFTAIKENGETFSSIKS